MILSRALVIVFKYLNFTFSKDVLAVFTHALSRRDMNIIYLVLYNIEVVPQDLIGAPQEGRNLWLSYSGRNYLISLPRQNGGLLHICLPLNKGER
jgi:hypothetical protein